MKMKQVLVAFAAVAALSGASVAPASAKQVCEFNNLNASKNPGQYFKLALTYAPWNPGGLVQNVVAFLAFWQDPTAETVGEFIHRDCSKV